MKPIRPKGYLVHKNAHNKGIGVDMRVHNKDVVVAFDVDGCLIGFDEVPREHIVSLFKMFKDLGCTMVVWSSGGKEYAQKWHDFLGLSADHVEDKFDTQVQAHIAFDDDRYIPWIGKVQVQV